MKSIFREVEYVVERPIRGTQTLSVMAKSKKEALEKANSFNAEGIDFHIHYYGKARHAIRWKSS